jgi:phenylpropionate dioxygenase-like ring-hydroxylating dioxygenase large terminal subunit
VNDRGFPFPVPFGWFSAGRLDELPDAAISELRYVGRDLVLWRDGDDFRLFDAYCPHLGAHLGDGRVEDGCLVCPFHEWAFDASGSNVAIPYADRPNRKARLRGYPTVVRNRQLLFWYHPDADVAPMWDVPEIVDADAVECMRMTRTVRTVWQEIAENSVDMAHFASVHGMPRVGEIGDLDIDGHLRRVRSSQAFTTSKGTFEGAIESNSHGPGVGLVRFELMSVVRMVTGTTPIDDGSVEVRFTLYHDRGDELGAKIGQAFGAEVARQFDQDIPIWERKHYQPVPALAPSEKPVTEFRRWARQFYADR